MLRGVQLVPAFDQRAAQLGSLMVGLTSRGDSILEVVTHLGVRIVEEGLLVSLVLLRIQ